jgi:hypothetical protein
MKMVTGKPKASRFVRRAMRATAEQTETGTLGSRGRRPFTEALVKILNRKVPNDPRGRTVIDLIAEALVRKAIEGDVRAIKEITDRVEGRVPLPRQGEHDERPAITIISHIPRPSRNVPPVPVPISAAAS